MIDPVMDRQRMVEAQIHGRGIFDARVLEAMRRVPRHEFVPLSLRAEAYEDHPLPIGDGQTISQPYVVAVMLEALQLKPTDIVLEIGTGSGYATALLAELAAKVYSMERHTDLVAGARAVLGALGYANVNVSAGDGTLGLPAYAPFDAILVSAGAVEIPSALVAQLRDGGRMIIPVGPGESQRLQFIRMQGGQAIVSELDPVRFVPLISDQV